MNTEAYVSALQSFVTVGPSTYSYLETNFTQIESGYKVFINKNELSAGDIINFFNIISDDITQVAIVIDGNYFASKNFSGAQNVTYEPFIFGINTVACDKSTIELYIKCDRVPTVYTYYTLVNNRETFYRKTIQGECSYKNGIFTKIYDGPCR